MVKIKFLFISILFCVSWACCQAKQDERGILDTLIFFENPDSDIPNVSGGVYFSDIDVPEPDIFVSSMEEFFGRSVNTDLLNDIRENILKYYHEKGHSVVSVVFPAGQDVTDGTLEVQIVVGKLGSVRVSGANYSSEERIAKEIKTREGDFINNEVMIEDVAWINNSPFRSASLVYERGEEIGVTNVLLNIDEKSPYRCYVDATRSEYKTAGDCRFKVGCCIGGFTEWDHQINGQYTMANSPGDLWGWSANYVAPLPWRHVFKVFGGFVKTLPNVGGYTVNGRSWQAGARYVIPFKGTKFLQYECSLGYDFSRVNNFFVYGGKALEGNHKYVDVSQFLVRGEMSYEFSKDILSCGLSLYFSPGKMTKYNETYCYKDVSTSAKSRYYYGILNFDNVLQLPQDFSWVAMGMAQYSPKTLLPSQQMALGGWATVRGYEENAVSGDTGLLLRNELRTFPIEFKTFKKLPSKVQFLYFVDAGTLTGIRYDAYDRTHASLVSTGVGARYAMKDNLDIKLDYGYVLKSIKDSSKKYCWHASITASY